MANRYIAHSDSPDTDLSTAKEAILEALLHNVQLVHKHYRRTPSDYSVYVGTPGVAMMYDYLSDLSLPELSSQNLGRSDEYLYAALSSSSHALATPTRASKAGFLTSSVGLATLILIRALQHHQSHSHRQSGSKYQALADTWPSSIKVLNSALQLAVESRLAESDDGCEVLYGRAGLLYALLRLRSELDRIASSSRSPAANPSVVAALQPLVTDAVFSELVDIIVQRGKNGSAAYATGLTSAAEPGSVPALMWSWLGKRYLGGAHGVVGILQMVLSCPANIITMHIPFIFDTVEWLVECQDVRGNWPTRASTSLASKHNELLHWCHGAPGFLMLFSTLLRLSASPTHPLTLSPALHSKLVGCIQRGADLVFKEGFLRKGVGNCHGIGGSVYALLAVSEVLDPAGDSNQTCTYFLRATELAYLATKYQSFTNSGEMRTPDHPWSLYEGIAGMCCGWGAVLQKLGANGSGNFRSGMPGYTDIKL